MSALTCAVLSAKTTASGAWDANHLSALCVARSASDVETQEGPSREVSSGSQEAAGFIAVQQSRKGAKLNGDAESRVSPPA